MTLCTQNWFLDFGFWFLVFGLSCRPGHTTNLWEYSFYWKLIVGITRTKTRRHVNNEGKPWEFSPLPLLPCSSFFLGGHKCPVFLFFFVYHSRHTASTSIIAATHTHGAQYEGSIRNRIARHSLDSKPIKFVGIVVCASSRHTPGFKLLLFTSFVTKGRAFGCLRRHTECNLHQPFFPVGKTNVLYPGQRLLNSLIHYLIN